MKCPNCKVEFDTRKAHDSHGRYHNKTKCGADTSGVRLAQAGEAITCKSCAGENRRAGKRRIAIPDDGETHVIGPVPELP